MYLCKFDKSGYRTSTVAEGLHFKTDEEKQRYIADGYLETSDEDYEYYVGNMGNGANGTGYVRGEDGKPTDAPPPPEPTKEDKLNALNMQYDQDKATLVSEYTDALIHDDDETADAIKEEMLALDEQYDLDYQAIMEEE